MLKTCPKGHRFHKTSDCPTCPTCEAERAPTSDFLSELSAPARRALEAEGISTLAELSNHTERDILQLHGMGPKSIPTLRAALEAVGLMFKDP